jgi:nitrogen fixation protein NifU and related proteins
VTSSIDDLYQEVILDHNRRPRNFGPLENASRTAEGHNPLCGDVISVAVRLDGDRISGVKFQGAGCAISKASASLMTEAVKGMTVHDAKTLFGCFHDMLAGPGLTPGADVGKLEVFAGVREFPVRVKCATLAWHTLRAALDGTGGTVSTE